MLIKNRIPVWYIFNKIKVHVTYVLGFSISVYLLSQYYGDAIPVIELSIPAFIGTAISILLSFKLSQSYERWWEARRIWGSIVNDSRTLVMQLQSFVAPGNEKIIERMAHRQIAWCYSLGQSLRRSNPKENLGKLISKEELIGLDSHDNKPLALIQNHREDLRNLYEAGKIETFPMVQIENTFVKLVDSMGMAERIKSTVFPITYRLFLHFTIYFFIGIFTISVRDFEYYYQIPLVLVISSIFLLLEKTATHLQDPFEDRPTDTAMTAIARTIEINIRQLLKEKDIPEPMKPNGFYLS